MSFNNMNNQMDQSTSSRGDGNIGRYSYESNSVRSVDPTPTSLPTSPSQKNCRKVASVSKKMLRASDEKSRKSINIELDVENVPLTQFGSFNSLTASHRATSFVMDTVFSDCDDINDSFTATVKAADEESSVLYDLNNLKCEYDFSTSLSFTDFKNVREIASGSNSIVYSGSYCGETVAVKMIRIELEASDKVQREFDFEFNILSRLKHPNVIRVLGKGLVPRKFIVMEFLHDTMSGRLQRNVIKSDTPSISVMFHRYTFPHIIMLKEAKLLAGALDYLHNGLDNCTIIHRGERLQFKYDHYIILKILEINSLHSHV
jgi:Protein tyrosine and serine/threonine kinase